MVKKEKKILFIQLRTHCYVITPKHLWENVTHIFHMIN